MKPHSSLFIDAVSPLLTSRPETAADYLTGGVSAVGATIPPFQGGTFVQGIEGATQLRQLIRSHPQLQFVETIADISSAQERGKLGVFLHAQSLQFIEDTIDYLDTFRLLGLRMAQIAYNRSNMLGGGCREESNGGLTRLGHQAVARMNDVGIVVDVSHGGQQMSLDAIHASRKPVVFSHSGAKALHEHIRNLTDEQIRAAADSHGLVGVFAPPYFIGDRPLGAEQVVKHVQYIADLVGVEHVALGLDYAEFHSPYMTVEQQIANDASDYDSGLWDEGDFFPAPNSMPRGIETPDKLPVLVIELEKSFTKSEVARILGQNWLRVFQECW